MIIPDMGQYGLVSAAIMILIGLVFAFIGRDLLEKIAMIIGAIVGALLAYYFITIFEDYFEPNEGICLIIGVILGAIIGAYLGRSMLHYLIASFLTGIIIMMVRVMTDDRTTLIIISIITFIIIILLIRQFLAVMTAIFGGALVGFGAMVVLFSLVTENDMVLLAAFLMVTIIIGGLGASHQLKSKK